MDERILDAIHSPADLKLLTDDELAVLAMEIREEIISTTSRTGGHVASSLGAVEIILALHSIFDCPEDKIVFDVGHQAYAHKLVTGRRDAFDTLRTFGGISGFPKPHESEFDTHPSGHASDSLSTALGLALARDARGTNERICAVIGDASLSGGMSFEALNHIGQAQTPMIIVLNDNEMSISKNVGALMKHLGDMRVSTQYRKKRDTMEERLESVGRFGNVVASLGRSMRESVKQLVIPHSMIFEQLGIVCTAPIDGHDISLLRDMFETVKDSKVPVLVHVVTKKGAGYKPAESFPERFHGIAPFDIATGEVRSGSSSVPSYTSVFSGALLREAEADSRIFGITAAMRGGTGLTAFAERFPERFIDTGIAEEHAVCLASGLAAGGMKPVVAVYSTFLQRAVDQLIINNALANRDVVFAIDRAGVVGEDGPTHHGVFDLVYTRMVPGMRVLAPSDEAELCHALHTALMLGGPVALRYPRGAASGVPIPEEPELLEVGKSRTVREGSSAAVLSFGHMLKPVMQAAELLAAEGIELRVVDMRWAKPLDLEAIRAAAELPLVVTAECGVIAGGVGEAVVAELSRMRSHVPVRVLGIDDVFVEQGKTDLLMADLGLDAQGIASAVREELARIRKPRFFGRGAR